MNNNKTTFAIVGFGGMGTQHSVQLKAVSEAVVKGIYDIKEDRQRAARDSGYIAYDSYNALLADGEIDIVLIATPNNTHKDLQSKRCGQAKNVICEKPVTLDSAELAEILEAQKKSGKVFVVHQNRRWDEDFLTVKKIYDEKLVGEVFRIESRIHGSRGIPGDWRRLKESGGGMMLDWGVHLLDRLLMLVEGKITSVFCRLSFQSGKDVDDGFILQLEYDNKKTVLVDVGTCNYINLPKWYVCGDKGTAVIEDWEMNGKMTVLVDENSMDVNPVVAGAGFTKTMALRLDGSAEERALPRVKADEKDYYRNVIAAVRGEAEQIVKNEQVMRVMKLVDAAFRSHETNQVVAFE